MTRQFCRYLPSLAPFIGYLLYLTHGVFFQHSATAGGGPFGPPGSSAPVDGAPGAGSPSGSQSVPKMPAGGGGAPGGGSNPPFGPIGSNSYAAVPARGQNDGRASVGSPLPDMLSGGGKSTRGSSPIEGARGDGGQMRGNNR